MDCFRVGMGKRKNRRAIFIKGRPKWFRRCWNDVKTRVRNGPQADDWAFWLDWYEQSLPHQGKPQNVDLLQEIALQENEFWEGSDAAVNARIAELVAKHEAPLEAELKAPAVPQQSRQYRSRYSPSPSMQSASSARKRGFTMPSRSPALQARSINSASGGFGTWSKMPTLQSPPARTRFRRWPIP